MKSLFARIRYWTAAAAAWTSGKLGDAFEWAVDGEGVGARVTRRITDATVYAAILGAVFVAILWFAFSERANRETSDVMARFAALEAGQAAIVHRLAGPVACVPAPVQSKTKPKTAKRKPAR